MRCKNLSQHCTLFFVLVTAWISSCPAYAQLSEPAAWAAQSTIQYKVPNGITYLVANNYEAKLDVFQPLNASGPTPTLIYIHGGGWVGGDKNGAVPQFIPYLEMGWAVVNVEYRLGQSILGSGRC